MTNLKYERLILILGDQLTPRIAALRNARKQDDLILMAEVEAEATYVRHHKKKIVFIFSAMRHFADALRRDGWRVEYTKIDACKNSGSLFGEVDRCLNRTRAKLVTVTEPGEWRLRSEMELWQERLGVPVEILPDDRFLCSHREFGEWAGGRKVLRMEYFYRDMRRRFGLLMDGDEPAGRQWNFDASNRKPADSALEFPEPARFAPDEITREVIDTVGHRYRDHFGAAEPFWFAVTPDDALAAFTHFLETALVHFGDYQDAMLSDERFLFHAVISAYMNSGLLDPLDVCERVEQAYRTGSVPINSAEGFIRQIVGWREYVRGIYWLKMPGYSEMNALKAERPLPWFYWSGETDMTCIATVIRQTSEEAYAHHIQRLMITGNFALLAGIRPAEVHNWYLAVYADAFEWVELPNTIGMSQFADGGLLASKPYASSGNYINRMSDYCRKCRYSVKEKSGDDACPYNYLYWDFLARNGSMLRTNPRLANAYRTWDQMPKTKQLAYRESARKFLEEL